MDRAQIVVLDAHKDSSDIVAVMREASPSLYGQMLQTDVIDIGGTWFGVRSTSGRLVAGLWGIITPHSAYLDYLAAHPRHPGAGMWLLRTVALSILPAVGITHLFATVSHTQTRWRRVLARTGCVLTGPADTIRVQVVPASPLAHAIPYTGTQVAPPDSVAHRGSQGPSR